jgi:hypothetical protein
MNAYPSWIHRIPEMIESLALLDREWIDRELVESIFDLRKTAAFHLLRRMGAQRCGNSLVIGRGLLMARLREAQENRDWRWEAERRQAVQRRIESSKHSVAGNRSCPWMPLFKNRWTNCERPDYRARSKSPPACSLSDVTASNISYDNSSSSPKWRTRISQACVR